MNNPQFKIVKLPITTPNSDYCWDGKNPCEHFNSEGGHYTCNLNIGDPINTKGFAKKPQECKKLSNYSECGYVDK